jgi:hypothetical protein
MKSINLTQMLKKDVQKFEYESTPIENIFNIGGIKRIYLMNKMIRLSGWYHKHDLLANVGIRNHWNKLTELLGFKPSYYVTYEFRNAVWGFIWRENRILFSKSLRGINIQVANDFDVNLVIPLIKDLILKLKA